MEKRYKEPVTQIPIPTKVFKKLTKFLKNNKDPKFKYVLYGEVVEAGLKDKQNGNNPNP